MGKLTGRSSFGAILSAFDLLHIVDVSDNAQDPAGSSYKLTLGQLIGFIQPNLTYDNIYNIDGSLSASRVVTMGNNSLTFTSAGVSSDLIVSNTHALGNSKWTFNTLSKTANINLDESNNKFTLITSDSNIDIKAGGLRNIDFQTNGVSRLFISSTGNVGINTSSPAVRLHVDDTANSFKESIFAYNTNGGVNAAVSIGVYNGSAGMTFGILGSGNTAHPQYGAANWGFFNLGASNGVNFVGTSPKYRFYNGLASGTVSFAIDGGNKISMPLLQTGNAGLVTGDLYKDTAANILANGDLVIGIKV